MLDIRLSGEHPAEGSRPKKRLKRRSAVWEHFDLSPDGQVATCKYCSKDLSGNSKGGTSHLTRHFDTYHNRDVNQPVTLDSRDEVRNIGLTQKETLMEDVVKKAILKDIPLASPDFKNGWYSSMEPMDVEKEIYAYYKREKENLAIELNNLTSRICFSVEITMGEINERFLLLTAHFINADFNLVRKVISFKELSDDSLSSIINVLESCISEWKLEEKIFTFTIGEDNDIFDIFPCDELIEGLREKFSPKMLFGGHQIRVLCCRGQLDQSCDSFCESPFYSGEGDSTKRFLQVLTTAPSKIDTFNQIAIYMGLPSRNESWFHDHSIYVINLRGLNINIEPRLLKDMLIYRDVFSRYYAHTETDQFLFSGTCSYSFHWQILELMLDIRKLVNCAINELHSFKHPSSHLYLRKFFEIVDMIAIKKKNSGCLCQDGECRVHDWEYLRDQFVRFVIEAEDIFIVAGVLDPRLKLSFFEYCMKEMGNFIGLEKTISGYREIVTKFFSEYAKKEADHVSPSLVGNINTQVEGNLLSNLPPTTITDRFSLHIRGMSELDEYLGEKLIDIGDADFDLLGWWKQNQSRFPVLSRMARDILAVPACVYRASYTIEIDLAYVDLDEVDICLVEAVICSKDWILDREKRDVSEPKN